MRTAAAGLLLAAATGCATAPRAPSASPPPVPQGQWVPMTVTAYCPCGHCCGWRRNCIGVPVYASGPHAGERKTVGICADGSTAEYGTIAADTRSYPFGTRMFVPGYGEGVVRDTGGAIKGPATIDVYMPSHGDACEWGRRRLRVFVYR